MPLRPLQLTRQMRRVLQEWRAVSELLAWTYTDKIQCGHYAGSLQDIVGKERVPLRQRQYHEHTWNRQSEHTIGHYRTRWFRDQTWVAFCAHGKRTVRPHTDQAV